MKFALLSILSIIAQTLFSQTCVIVNIFNNEIYVGADSRVRVNIKNIKTGDDTTFFASTCKITKSGKFNFAVIGFQGDLNYHISLSKCAQAKNLEDLQNLIDAAFGQALVDTLEHERKTDFNYYKSRFQYNGVVSQTLIFGFENDKPKVVLTQFVLNSNFDKNAQIRTENYIIIKPFAMGEVDEIFRDSLLNKTKTWANGIVSGIKYLINYSEKYHPLDVGGDIDIIKINQHETQWIYKKKECQ